MGKTCLADCVYMLDVCNCRVTMLFVCGIRCSEQVLKVIDNVIISVQHLYNTLTQLQTRVMTIVPSCL